MLAGVDPKLGLNVSSFRDYRLSNSHKFTPQWRLQLATALFRPFFF
jgi:hypothetical protein